MNAAKARLERLFAFLREDPGNLSLITDAAEASYAADDLERAAALIQTYGARSALTVGLTNLSGLIALRTGDTERAASLFEAALTAGGPDSSIAYNLAWARIRLGDAAGSLDALDLVKAPSTAAIATLRIQALHMLGRPAEALALGAEASERFPQDVKLMSILAVAALDHGDLDLAGRYAGRGGEFPDALAVLGALELDAGRPDVAKRYFDRALAEAPNHARSLLGKGLQLLIEGRPSEAAPFLDTGAAVFQKHLGSWIAAGWAHFLSGDLARARSCFERTLALDERFAEAQGGLAVIDIAEGQIEAGRRRASVALRLDRNCLSGALAQMMLLERQGRGDTAAQIRDLVLNRPFTTEGASLAQMVGRLGAASRSHQ